MSLHNLAQHLQSAGRGNDKVLVHMTPGEVKGLQALAMAHGGSLTINPQTGLPEAGFLSSLLPTIAGIALNAFAPGIGTAIGGALGTSAAAGTGLFVGGVTTLATGSLGKGIMAGLGAYGGAGLGGALAGGAAGALASGADDALSAANLFKGASAEQLQQAFPTIVSPEKVSPLAAAATRSAPAALQAAYDPALKGLASNAAITPIPPAVSTPPVSSVVSPTAAAAVKPQPTGLFGLDTRAGTEKLSAVGQGLKDIATDPKKLIQFVKDNPYESAAVASSIYSGMQEDQKFPGQKKGEPLKKLRYEYDPFPVGVAGTSERNYFPGARFTPTGEVYAAGGGLMGLAEGGTVEEMSRLNAVGANTMYPMANQMSQRYATPKQRPISENVVRPEGEARLDPYTGEQKFSNGGDVAAMFQAAGLGAPTESQVSYWSGVPDAASRIAAAASISKAASATPVSTPVSTSAPSGVVSGGGVATPAPSPQLRSQIEQLYQSELYRPADPGGLQHYQNLFAGGATPGLDPDEITLFRTAGGDEFSSPEFAARKAAATGTAAAKAASEAAAKKAAEEAAAKKTTTGITSQGTTTTSPFDTTTFKLGSQAPTIGTQTLAASPKQVADAYERVLGRQVDLPGLEYYTRQGRMSPAALEQTLQYSPEFFENLAKPLVPKIVYDSSGRAMIEGGVPYNPAQYGYAGPVVPALPLPKMSATAPTTPSGVASLPAGTAGAGAAGAGAAGTGVAGAAGATGTTATTGREISTAPGAYMYNYFENKPEENALIRQFQTGPNEKARADLTELYMTKLGRLPDTPGFDYYMKTIGADNLIDAKEAELFMNNAATELADKQALTALYRQVGGRDPDIPGLEYYMSEIGKAGGIDPIKDRLIAGLKKEVDMANAGYRGFDPNQMGSRMTQAEADALNAKAPFLYGTIPGTVSSKYPAGIDNNKAREQLYNLYEQKLGRAPDMAGFDYWISQFGNDNVVDAEETAKFLQGAREAGETVRMAGGGIANLGGYSDGGRLLKGPGDGVSDSIPAVIGERQPARLADGEFVIPARIVSELGNGSTDAGARKLYAMMDRIQRARKKSVGKERVAVNSKADKYLPA